MLLTASVPLLLLAVSAGLADVDSNPCAPSDNFDDFCSGTVWASIQVMMMNETVVAVPLRRRWTNEVATTTSSTTTTTTTTTTLASITTEERHAVHKFQDYEDYGYAFWNYDAETMSPETVQDLNAQEVLNEQWQREKERAEQEEYKKRYCEDNDEEPNTRLTGVGAPRRYEVFPGVGAYWFHRAPLPWEEARRRCEMDSAHLLVLDSDTEWAVASQLLGRCPELLHSHFNDYMYVGVSKAQNGGHFVTVLGDPLESLGYVHWMEGQPDNAHHLGENCLSVTRKGTFNDVPCDTALPFICEFDY